MQKKKKILKNYQELSQTLFQKIKNIIEATSQSACSDQFKLSNCFFLFYFLPVYKVSQTMFQKIKNIIEATSQSACSDQFKLSNCFFFI